MSPLILSESTQIDQLSIPPRITGCLIILRGIEVNEFA